MAPERLSSVGARNAQAGASRGANTPGMGTPAETILGGQEHDEAADIAEPVRSSLEPIPEAGSEIDTRPTDVYPAQRDLRTRSGRGSAHGFA